MANSKQITPMNNRETSWLILPFLHYSVEQFMSLYNSSINGQTKKNPIMIIGDPGVGKSLFVHIYRSLYEADHPKAKSVRINVAAIPKNLIESELFGYEKGAFTGAGKGMSGLVETADLLILEEIGELPKSVQAKLLTFIEDGYYYRVGGREEKRTKDIQIISTTNKKAGDFRQDFFNRFFIFPVPPMHERRMDVLFYLDEKIPNIISQLRAHEVLSLLTYNWPGNMREIDHVIQEAIWLKHFNHDHSGYNSTLLSITSTMYPFRHSSVDWYKPGRLYNGLVKANVVNIKLMENILNKDGLGLDTDNTRKSIPIRKFLKKLSEKEQAFDHRFATKSILVERPFDLPYMHGLINFCGLFGGDYDENVDLLDIVNILPSTTPVVAKAMNSTNQPYENIRYKMKTFINSLKQSDKMMDPLELKEKDLIDLYRKKLFDKCGGNIKKASRISGVSESTLRSHYKKIIINKHQFSR